MIVDLFIYVLVYLTTVLSLIQRCECLQPMHYNYIYIDSLYVCNIVWVGGLSAHRSDNATNTHTHCFQLRANKITMDRLISLN